MKVLILIPFLLYLIVLFSFDLFSKRKISSGTNSFFPGDTKVHAFVAAISMAVSARGSWLLLGVTTQAYILGLSAVWLVAGFIVSEFFLLLFLAPAIHKFAGTHNCLTINDLFTSRFKGENKALRMILTVVLLFFSISFISAQFIGGGIAFYAFAGISNAYGIIITGVIVLFIILFGGFKALTNLDVFQSLIILCIFIVIPATVIIRSEGPGNLYSEILKTNPGLFDLRALSAGTLLGFLSIGLGSTGNPGIIAKYMSVSESGSFRKIAFLNTSVSLLLATGALLTGMFARYSFPFPDSIPGADPNNVFIGLAGATLSPLMLGVVLCSIFAAGLSASGTHIIVSASTVFSEFFDKTHSGIKNISQAKLNYLSRASIVLIVYIAIFAGALIDSGFYGLMLFAWGGLGASFGPAILFSFWWKETTANGIIAGVVTGALTVIIWKSIPFLSENVYELIPGFMLSSIAVWIGSTIDKMIVTSKYNRTARFEDIKKSGFWE